MSFFTKAVINELIDAATDPEMAGPDPNRNQQVAAHIYDQPDYPKKALSQLKKKLQTKNTKVQVCTLVLIDYMMRTCKNPFLGWASKGEFLEEVVKLARGTRTDPVVQRKALECIMSWALCFEHLQNDYPEFSYVYQQLLSEGLQFPPLDPEKIKPVGIDQDQIQFASAQYNPSPVASRQYASTSGGDYNTQPVTPSDNVPVPVDPEYVQTQLESLRNSLSLLQEMLSFADPVEDIRKNELIVDLHQSVVVARTRLQRWIDDWVSAVDRPGADKLVPSMLQINDEINNTMESYDQRVKAQAQLLSQPQSPPIQPAALPTQPKYVQPVAQDNLFADEKPAPATADLIDLSEPVKPVAAPSNATPIDFLSMPPAISTARPSRDTSSPQSKPVTPPVTKPVAQPSKQETKPADPFDEFDILASRQRAPSKPAARAPDDIELQERFDNVNLI